MGSRRSDQIRGHRRDESPLHQDRDRPKLGAASYLAHAARSVREGRAGLGEAVHGLCTRLPWSRLFRHPTSSIRCGVLCSLSRRVSGCARPSPGDTLRGFHWRRHRADHRRTAQLAHRPRDGHQSIRLRERTRDDAQLGAGMDDHRDFGHSHPWGDSYAAQKLHYHEGRSAGRRCKSAQHPARTPQGNV